MDRIQTEESPMLRFVGYVWAWLGPASKSFDLLRISALSAAIGFFLLYVGNIGVENGSSLNVEWAEAIVNGTKLVGNKAFYLNEVGMPLIILVSGYTFTHSLVGLIIIQTLMAMSLPALAYLTLRPWFPKTAYVTAIVSIISLSPFLLMKTFHHDEPYMFFMMLGLSLINRYVWSQRPINLYAMTFVTILYSLIRQAGRGIYPFLVLACLLESSRRNYRHLVICVLAFIVANVAYLHYRESMLGRLPFLGTQIFENVYFNSAEYGVRLSADFGPNMKTIIDRMYKCSLPSPAQSKKFHEYLPPNVASFAQDNFYRYTAEEMVDKFFTVPNFTYYYLLVDQCLGNDLEANNRILIGATLEVARARPFYVISYIARNVWLLMFDPGWTHAQYSTLPLVKEGLHFPFGGATTAGWGVVAEPILSSTALHEAAFLPLVRQPAFVRHFYLAMEQVWARYYHSTTVILGILTCVTWVSTAIGLLARLFRSARLRRWSDLWLGDRVLTSSLAASILLVTNIGTTAVFVEALYRYDFSLLMLKFILAGVGCAVVVNLVRAAATRRIPAATDQFDVPDPYFAAVASTQRGVGASNWAATGALKSLGYQASGLLRSPAGAYGIGIALLCLLTLVGYEFFNRQVSSPAEPFVAADANSPASSLDELPQLPAGMRWDVIWGLNAQAVAGPSAVAGQTPLRLTAVPSNSRHAVAVQVQGSVPGVYRAKVWVKAAAGTDVQLQVRDAVDPRTGTADEGVARFDLVAGSASSAEGNVLATGSERTADGWEMVWVDLRSGDGQVYVTVGLIGAVNNKDGSNLQLTLGGIAVAPTAAAEANARGGAPESSGTDGETTVDDLPLLPSPAQWDFISGLRATPLDGPRIVDGQTPIQLTAVLPDGRHMLAMHLQGLVAGTVYRATVWLEAPVKTNAELAVRDSVDPQTGKAHESDVRFDLASGTPLTVQGNVLGQGIEHGHDDWLKLWVDFRTADGQLFVTVGMLEAGSNSQVFKSAGQQLTFGGIDVEPRPEATESGRSPPDTTTR